jgi:hypothetical protein
MGDNRGQGDLVIPFIKGSNKLVSYRLVDGTRVNGKKVVKVKKGSVFTGVGHGNTIVVVVWVYKYTGWSDSFLDICDPQVTQIHQRIAISGDDDNVYAVDISLCDTHIASLTSRGLLNR